MLTALTREDGGARGQPCERSQQEPDHSQFDTSRSPTTPISHSATTVNVGADYASRAPTHRKRWCTPGRAADSSCPLAINPSQHQIFRRDPGNAGSRNHSDNTETHDRLRLITAARIERQNVPFHAGQLDSAQFARNFSALGCSEAEITSLKVGISSSRQRDNVHWRRLPRPVAHSTGLWRYAAIVDRARQRTVSPIELNTGGQCL